MANIQFLREELQKQLHDFEVSEVGMFDKIVPKLVNHIDQLYQALEQQQAFNAKQAKQIVDLEKN